MLIMYGFEGGFTMKKIWLAPLMMASIALTPGCWSNKLEDGLNNASSFLSVKPAENGYAVIYDGNGATGGSVPVDSAAYLNGDAVTVLDNTGSLELTGYDFAGWSEDPGGAGALLTPGTTFIMVAADVTLFAIWTPAQHTVIYDANGATGGAVPVDNTLYVSGDTVTVLDNTGSLSWYGADFLGWNTRADGTGTDYSPGSAFSMGGADVTLYADWYRYFAGGDGTAADPFQVANPEHLNNVRYFLDAYFIQTANIDLNVSAFNTGTGWEPIGNSSTPFLGNYNGNNLEIINLYINRSTEDNIGLFGYADGAVLKNITLYNADVAGNQNVGALVGFNSNWSQFTPAAVGNPLIGNCSVSGAVVTGVTNIGGLVGYTEGSASSACLSVIEDCFAVGIVSGTGTNVGGLAGSNVYNATVSTSYASVTVIGGTMYTGGLTGYSCYTAKIFNSYAVGAVAGSSRVGGLTGFAESSTANYCYAACAVSGTSDLGGLIGVGGASTVSSYYDASISGQSDTGKGTPLPTTGMLQQASFTGWNFTTIWDISKGASYPFLQWQGGVNIPVP